MPHVSCVCDFVPTLDDLARWRLETNFVLSDVVRIASVSESAIHRWIDSGVFQLGEHYRVHGAAVSAQYGRYRFARAGLIRIFREHCMAQALINLGETPSCYAVYVGSNVDACRRVLCAHQRDIVAIANPFLLGQLIFRDRPGVVIVDFSAEDLPCDDYVGLIRLCEQIRTTTALDPVMRPAVLGLGLSGAGAESVDYAVTPANIFSVTTKICSARLSI